MVTVGLIGLGKMGLLHLGILNTLDDVDLVLFPIKTRAF